ncbi:cystathionine gamma-synthase [Chondrinema litorale]|uniref:cystathionine gamma-synthase n=1 Tax=Chondrinema litorale TaxID=2994555 RepID=UPI002542C77B|nr:cystathionine gamma-synthase [Chondrinema litorale]UZR96231.1 cystathionine gamma-synthase [Chondrinema litorale]
MTYMKFGTKAVHAGVEPDPTTGAIMTPIYQTSTYVQESPGKHKGYEYARTQNPTRDALQASLAALENGKYGLCYATGLAATDTIMKTLRPGDEVICTNDMYGGTYRLFTTVFQPFGIKFIFVPMAEAESVEQYVTDKTKMVWVETPTNPLMNVIDIEKIAAITKKHEVLLTVDNTFATPYLQNPLDLGADIVMHSVTKYLGGHSDTVMGAIITNNEKLYESYKFLQNAAGGTPGPQDCFLVLRGIKTLHLRMRQHCINGKAVAEFLEQHPLVGKVYYPGLESHKGYEIAKKQMRDFGGMVSFTLKDDKVTTAIKTLENFNLFALAESLGGVESLCGHPASMTHASIPPEERKKSGLSDSLIRLSVGIEDTEDLIADLKQAIESASKA